MDVFLDAMQPFDKMSFKHPRSYRAKKKVMSFYILSTVKILRSPLVRVMTRMLFLAMVFLSLPSLISMIKSGSSQLAKFSPDEYSDSVTTNYFKILPVLCHDLIDEGLIKKGHKGIIVGAENKDIDDDDYEFLRDSGVDLMTEAGIKEKEVIEYEPFDFVFAMSFDGIKMIDRAVKNGGMAISPLSNNAAIHSLKEMNSLNNYKIVYLRMFKSAVVAMRKKDEIYDFQ